MSGAYTGWAVLEVNGYRKHVGLVSEVQRFGEPMCRIEAIVGHDFDKREVFVYGGKAIFSLKEITEEEARAEIAPPSWETHRQLPAAPAKLTADDGFFDDVVPEGAQEMVRDANRWGWVEGLLRASTKARAALTSASRLDPLTTDEVEAISNLADAIETGIASRFITADGAIPIEDPLDDDAPDSVDPSELANEEAQA